MAKDVAFDMVLAGCQRQSNSTPCLCGEHRSIIHQDHGQTPGRAKFSFAIAYGTQYCSYWKQLHASFEVDR
jgi:hypothetical protein